MEKRTPNFTTKEKHLLLDIVAKYKEIVENKVTSTTVNNNKNKAWEAITAEFNAKVDTKRAVKHLRLLYANLKRKGRKDIAKDHQEPYQTAEIREEKEYRLQINKTGGGSYEPQLAGMGSQILANLRDQMQPFINESDDAADYFADIPIDREPEPKPKHEPVPKRNPIYRRKQKKITKKNSLNYKNLYFKKKYELACLELKSKKILHNLEVKIKKKQLELLESIDFSV